MTDIDTFLGMLERAGVVYTVRAVSVIAEDELQQVYGLKAHRAVRVQSEDSLNNIGFHGFYSESFFDIDGALLAVGAWE